MNANRETYKENRKAAFQEIQDILRAEVRAKTDHATVIGGDSLPLLKKLPDKCVSLILTDPPYHSTKKENIHGDTAFIDDGEYYRWIAEYLKEWRRILRDNGSIFCFSSATMAARLELLFRDEYNVLSHIVWTKPNAPGFDGWKQKMKKEALRQWYEHTERIIFAEPAEEGNLFRSHFGNFLRKARIASGLNQHEVTAITGAYGKVNHGGAVSNWEAGRNVPSRDQYQKLCDAFISTGKVSEMPPYEDIIRAFGVDARQEFTDVWNFETVRPYKGKHPAEKPQSLLLHAIQATTYDGDIVLDCFAGSGSTQAAALKLGRRAVSIEIDEVWVNRICDLLEKLEALRRPTAVLGNPSEIGQSSENGRKVPQQPLFV